jgi:Arm DNA-binding domain
MNELRNPSDRPTAEAGNNGGRRGYYKLSAVALKKKMAPGKYNDGGNLYLVVGLDGRRSWLFQYQLAGRQHGMGLGSLRTVSPKEAREMARQYRQQLRDGIDPLIARRAKVAANKAARTFRQCAEQYWARFAFEWSVAYAQSQRVAFERWVFRCSAICRCRL